MRVMPANSTGIWDAIARETGRLGHLYSPGAQRGPRPWFPYAIDNGVWAWFQAMLAAIKRGLPPPEWDEAAWWRLIFWAQSNTQKPLWVIAHDVVGDAPATIAKWNHFAPMLKGMGFTIALAVQNGMTVEMVKALEVQPDVICVGGDTEWKHETWRMWASNFPRVHVLRVNSPTWLWELEEAGVESCDGTGWNRGDQKQTRGLEEFLRHGQDVPAAGWCWPYMCNRSNPRGQKRKGQLSLLEAS